MAFWHIENDELLKDTGRPWAQRCSPGLSPALLPPALALWSKSWNLERKLTFFSSLPFRFWLQKSSAWYPRGRGAWLEAKKEQDRPSFLVCSSQSISIFRFFYPIKVIHNRFQKTKRKPPIFPWVLGFHPQCFHLTYFVKELFGASLVGLSAVTEVAAMALSDEEKNHPCPPCGPKSWLSTWWGLESSANKCLGVSAKVFLD